MLRSKLFAVGLLAAFLPSSLLSAEEEIVTEGGRRYLIKREVVSRPMSKTDWVEKTQEVYREEYTTDYKDTSRLVHVPVTEYRWEPQIVNRWNPFSQPYVVQRLVPRTHWEARAEVVKVPIVERRLVPETRIVRTPETRRWMEPETIERKVAIDPPLDQDVSNIARRQPIGGTRLESDPPKSTPKTESRYTR
jgi:hypothetical protein